MWKKCTEDSNLFRSTHRGQNSAKVVQQKTKITEIENKVSFPYEIVFQIREKRQKNDK